jgi:hypothetical protein
MGGHTQVQPQEGKEPEDPGQDKELEKGQAKDLGGLWMTESEKSFSGR